MYDFLLVYMCGWFGGAGYSCLAGLLTAQTLVRNETNVDLGTHCNIPVANVTGKHGFIWS